MSYPKEPVYNPDSEDFVITYDINGNNNPEEYILRANEREYFEPVIAQHIKHHLAKKILFKRGVRINPDEDLAGIMKELDYEPAAA